MNKIKLVGRSVAYSWSLIVESSKALILLYFFLTMLVTSFPLLTAFLLKSILDLLTVTPVQINRIFLLVGLYLLSVVLSQSVNSIQIFAKNTMIQKAQHLYDCRLSERLDTLSMDILDSNKGKDMVDDVRYAKQPTILLTFRITEIISHIYTFSVAFSTLITFSLNFSLLFLVFTIPSIAFNEYYARKSEDLRKRTAPDVRKFHYYRWMLTDSWPAKDVRMYNLTDSIKQRYNEEKSDYLKKNKALDKKTLVGNLLIESIRRSGEIVFVVYVVVSAIKGSISIGDVALYVGFSNTIANSFWRITWLITDVFCRISSLVEKVLAFFKLENKVSSSTKKLCTFESLAFDNVYFKYPHTDKYILSGTTFTLNAGDKLSIIGINGSGKSTIIKLMLGLYEIESGQICINGYPMEEYDIRDVRKLFSVLFQNFVQYPLTLRENIALSNWENLHDDNDIIEALKKSSVYGELSPRLENGIDSFMTRQFDDKGVELSKGQWQKVALSRSYFKNAPIVIFDEPSASLDAEAEDRIFKDFEKISDGKSCIMITHRISASRMANKIIVLNDGRILEHGTHDELMALDGFYAKLYNLQREKYTVTGCD